MTKIEYIEQETTKILQAYKVLEELGVVVCVSPVKLDTSAYLDIFGPIYHKRNRFISGTCMGIVELDYKGVNYYAYEDPDTIYYNIKNKDWGK